MILLVSILSYACVLLSNFLHFQSLLGYFPLLNNIYYILHIHEIELEGQSLIYRFPIYYEIQGMFDCLYQYLDGSFFTLFQYTSNSIYEGGPWIYIFV